MVYPSDEDFDSAALAEARKTVDIHTFVPREEIDPIFFERTYYLTPQDGGEKVYMVLARAMEESGLLAVATFSDARARTPGLPSRQRSSLTPRARAFRRQIRPAKDIGPKGVRVGKEELRMASQLVDRCSGAFHPESFKDTYRDALRKTIRAKERGETVPAAEPEQAEQPLT